MQEFLQLLKKSPKASIIRSPVGLLTLLADSQGSSIRSNHLYGSSKTVINALALMLASKLREQEGMSLNNVMQLLAEWGKKNIVAE